VIEDDGPLGCPCRGRHMALAWIYHAPPEGETPFPHLARRPYRREVRRCRVCHHFVLDPGVELEELYRGGYADATYGDAMRATFERIVALPPERSDNAGRVRRVVTFRDGARSADGGSPRVLDVGSGLAVFPWALLREGWRVWALDPDPRQVAHAREVARVPAICADFMTAQDLGTYDVVTLNKVLEHVPDPVGMLARTAPLLAHGGAVYLEVPDGAAASADGPGREEFFIEHLHAFSPESLAMLVRRAGLEPLRIERLREPSGKYTLVAFAGADGTGQPAPVPGVPQG
jgi:SAM-dependent methyltransferase